jgi:hypothetical protein
VPNTSNLLRVIRMARGSARRYRSPSEAGLAVLAAVIVSLGCAGSGDRAPSTTPVRGPALRAQTAPAGSVVPLAEDEGLLVVHVDSDAPLELLAAGDVAVVEDLAKGRYVWIVRLKSGRYAWTQIAFAPGEITPEVARRCIRDRVARINPLRDLYGVDRTEFEFDVKPGMLNYAGELILRVDYHSYCKVAYRMTIRNRNHSAMALRSLLATHPAYLEALPIRHAGRSGDGFLEFYSRERRRLGAAPPAEGR